MYELHSDVTIILKQESLLAKACSAAVVNYKVETVQDNDNAATCCA